MRDGELTNSEQDKQLERKRKKNREPKKWTERDGALQNSEQDKDLERKKKFFQVQEQ
jgi:hypothetical protein